jgi:hypothetical protein
MAWSLVKHRDNFTFYRACSGEMGTEYKILVGKPKRKRPRLR